MTKLTESAGSYMQKVLDMQEKMAAVPHENGSGRKEYTVSMVGKLLYTDMKEDSSGKYRHGIYLYPDGINLYEPLTVNGITFSTLGL